MLAYSKLNGLNFENSKDAIKKKNFQHKWNLLWYYFSKFGQTYHFVFPNLFGKPRIVGKKWELSALDTKVNPTLCIVVLIWVELWINFF